MSQLFANFTEKASSARPGAHIQTARADVHGINGNQLVEIDWDQPFADADYVVSLAVESETFQGLSLPINSFYKTVSSVFVTVSSTAFVPYTIHAVAFHA